MRAKLVIIIVHFNHPFEQLLKCLQAVNRAARPLGTTIIVLDNASLSFPRGKEKYLRDLVKTPWEVIRNPRNAGFGAACNQGFRAVDSEYYCVLNPDVEIGPKTLMELLIYHESHPRTSIVGPQLMYPDGTVQDSYRRFPNFADQVIKRTPLRGSRLLHNRVRHYLMWDKDKGKTEAVDWLVGACLMIRREALQDVGVFDERFFLFYEDVDLCRRMRAKGWSVVYHPAAKATHHHERLSAGGLLSVFTKKTLRIHLMSALKYFWKWRKTV